MKAEKYKIIAKDFRAEIEQLKSQLQIQSGEIEQERKEMGQKLQQQENAAKH